MPEGLPPLVAHVIHRLDYGGLENGLVNLVNNMPHERYDHAVICLAGFSDFRDRICRSDVRVLSIDKRPGKDPAAYVRLWNLLRRIRPAILHTRNLGTVDTQWVGMVAGVRHRVHGEHGWDAADPEGRDARSLRIRRACRPAVQQYVTMSKHLASWLERDVGVDAACIRQVYSGVDTRRFCADGPLPDDLPWAAKGPDRPVIVGTVARLDPVKNHGALLDAFARIRERLQGRRERLRLVIVGEGPLHGELQAHARKLGVQVDTWFPGARDDIPELLRAMDVFVLPSLNEGISNTILEAMATGLPVVAGNVGGNPELVVDGSTGNLYDPADPASLASAILRYLTDPALRIAHGTAGRERVVQNFSLDAMVGNYLALYDDLLTSDVNDAK